MTLLYINNFMTSTSFLKKVRNIFRQRKRRVVPPIIKNNNNIDFCCDNIIIITYIMNNCNKKETLSNLLWVFSIIYIRSEVDFKVRLIFKLSAAETPGIFPARGVH